MTEPAAPDTAAADTAAAGATTTATTPDAHSGSRTDVPRVLRRRVRRRLLGGVCGGLADYSGVDVALVRVLVITLTLVGGSGFVLYAAAWLLVPVEGSTRSLAERLLRR